MDNVVPILKETKGESRFKKMKSPLTKDNGKTLDSFFSCFKGSTFILLRLGLEEENYTYKCLLHRDESELDIP